MILIVGLLTILTLAIIWFKKNNSDVAFLIIVLISILLSFAIIVFLVEHIGVNVKIQQNNIRYESLLQQLELFNNEYEDINRITYLQELTEWNIQSITYNHYAHNPWTNWFCSQKVADSLKYIEVGW